ncbi:hypothetical protein EDD86DRAFT_263139 [Gorgonomyces haynaldii]|nr:hypothetical protein EDD86DRAFT_263139 [Gorgonomyces haynaldii]
MAEIVQSLGNVLGVRTYLEYYAATDPEFEVDSEDKEQILNPFIYRNIQNGGTLGGLAALLEAPVDWEQRYNQVVADGDIPLDTEEFRSLPDNTPESDIQSCINWLVSIIAARLRARIRPRSETKIIVGGILARHQYDLRSKTDPHFLNTSGQNLIGSEAKTHLTLRPSDTWYHGSRGVQTLSALYAFNCPTFLFTHRQWKLFVENTERNAILTFPYNDDPEHSDHVNSSLVQPMGTTFLKAIVICLLSQRFSLEKSEEAADRTYQQSNTLSRKQISNLNTLIRQKDSHLAY